MSVSINTLVNAEVSRPGRYLGNELGAAHKPWDGASVRWVLTYPEVYEVGASNLGHIILYSILNAQPRQLCDRAYLPAPDLAAKLKATQTPLFAVESQRSLTDFDILGFSLSYELGATNILEMLSLSGIPLTWQERDQAKAFAPEAGSWPLIFAGGQTATSNPEPYADFFDFVALGDGEELLPEIALVMEEGKAAGLSREVLLLDLAQVPGVYVPRFYDMADDGSVHPNRPDVPARVLRRVATPIPAYAMGLVPYVETVHDRLTVEIRRGCTRGCRFCQPGMLTRPARDVEPEAVIDAIETGMRKTGYDEFSLLSLSCSDYLALPAVGVEVKNRLKDENISLSLPSQRVDRFDENIANIIGGTRLTGLTFAPEAGTQRMRDIINKGLTNEELLRGIKTAHEQGWGRVKLYFMIGLPGETDTDVLGIAETVRWLRQACTQPGRRPLAFNITISNFTPKPHTPFQWHSVSTEEFRRKQRLLREEFRVLRWAKVNFTDVRISAMEDFVGRGDRRLSAVVRRAWELGAGMDSWWESLENAFKAWTQAIDEADLTWKYRKVDQGEWNVMDTDVTDVGVDRPSLDTPLPWDHVDTGIDKAWLKDDLLRAVEAATVPDCSFEGCSHCGVCGPDFGHNVVVPPPPIPAFLGHGQPNSERVQRLRVTLGKLGSMALLGHLDMVRLFDRALRRAGLPIAFTGGFHPGPRLSPANALPLGATSSGEVVDFELTQAIAPADFLQRLGAQLPPEIPLYAIAEVPLDEPSATKLLDQAEYYLHVSLEDIGAASLDWEGWIESVLALDEVPWEKKTKSGKMQLINLRERLHELTVVSPDHPLPVGLEYPKGSLGVWLRAVGHCRNDGNLLRPEHVVSMVEKVASQPLALQHVHRSRLIFL
ncbi:MULTISPECIES: TIGR03960 family B12-binding radical SAM protein [Cyanophyceae]|uniref:TIGR03960 family B12-binding radical SAM protein n=1 Tax=Leptolyngbya subtilissima DQ-A4 TaxID=2933933 RepID=A0ABV0JXL2_9CYAN|nr:TIGR03960 family B12-binding radical SAM protein [Nodosilinea sp. FACHB-141]MBD2111903.1 TIGR03960 family B12-binding radical SAM protein [Nodosilinea sp. FACHB-141]